MRVVKALHNFGFGDHKVSKAEIDALAALAKGEPQPPGTPVISFSYGSVSPAPGHVPPAVETVPTSEPPKPARGKKLPVEDASVSFLLDGALVED